MTGRNYGCDELGGGLRRQGVTSLLLRDLQRNYSTSVLIVKY